MDWMNDGGKFRHSIRGEFAYQDVIEPLYAASDDAVVIYPAVLELENSNPHDDQAVCLRIEGAIVGHLSRANARRFRRKLGAQNTPHAKFNTRAKLYDEGRTIEILVDIKLANDDTTPVQPIEQTLIHAVHVPQHQILSNKLPLKTKKKLGWGKILLLVFLGYLLIAWYQNLETAAEPREEIHASSFNEAEFRAKLAKSKAEWDAMTPQQQKRELANQRKKQEAAANAKIIEAERNGAAEQCIYLLTTKAKDPSSVTVLKKAASATSKKNYYTAEITIRAKNSFGALDVSVVECLISHKNGEWRGKITSY